MKLSKRTLNTANLAIVSFLLFQANAVDASTERKFATVNIVALDSYGKPQKECGVTRFVLKDDGVNSDLSNIDYADHFKGLTGTDIPFALDYRINLQCGGERASATFSVAVTRPDQTLVLAFWPHFGDYVTTLEPRLVVTVDGRKEGHNSEFDRVDVLGVFVIYRASASLGRSSNQSSFFDLEPGTYFVSVVVAGKLACTEKIDITDPHSKVRLVLGSIAPEKCEVAGGTGLNPKGDIK